MIDLPEEGTAIVLFIGMPFLLAFAIFINHYAVNNSLRDAANTNIDAFITAESEESVINTATSFITIASKRDYEHYVAIGNISDVIERKRLKSIIRSIRTDDCCSFIVSESESLSQTTQEFIVDNDVTAIYILDGSAVAEACLIFADKIHCDIRAVTTDMDNYILLNENYEHYN